MNFFYTVYNLIVESEIECKGLTETSANEPDIRVWNTEIPDNFINIFHEGTIQMGGFKINTKGEILIEVQNTARFLISKGSFIVVSPHPNADYNSIKALLLGPIFAILFHQRGMFTLKGIALGKNGKGLVITGTPDAHHSAFSKYLYENKYNVITEDVCLIEPAKNGKKLVHRAFPKVSHNMGINDIPGLREETNDKAKTGEKYLGYDVACNFEGQYLPIKTVYEIKPFGNTLQIKNLKGVIKISAMLAHTFRIKTINDLGLYNEHIIKFADIAHNIDVIRIMIPIGKFDPKEIVCIIKDDLNKL